MACSDCHKVNPIPYCFEFLVITDYGDSATGDYLLYIYDYANNSTRTIEVTADEILDDEDAVIKEQGIIQTDYRFQVNHTYKLSLKQDGVEVPFTVNSTEVCCVDVHVIDDNFEHETITLTDDGCTVE